MVVNYSLLILREDKEELQRHKALLNLTDAKKSARKITELKHKIADLEFAIEVLETYQD